MGGLIYFLSDTSIPLWWVLEKKKKKILLQTPKVKMVQVYYLCNIFSQTLGLRHLGDQLRWLVTNHVLVIQEEGASTFVQYS